MDVSGYVVGGLGMQQWEHGSYGGGNVSGDDIFSGVR